MIETGEIVLPVRIHQRIGGRQCFAGLMMIDGHHIEAERLGFSKRLDAGRPAIDRDEKLRTLRGERAHRFGVGPVSFEQSVGDVDQRLESAMTQELGQHRRRGRAVHVVVPEDRDRLAPLDRINDTSRGLGHVGQHVRIGHQPAHGRIEKLLHAIELDIAPRKNAREQFRHPVALRHRGGARLATRIKARAPDAPGHRALDTEECRGRSAEGG